MAGTVHAEVTEVRISKGYGITYLPVYVMDHEKLLEKHAKAAGLGDVKLSWHEIDGGGNIMDAMIASALEVAGIGTPGFLTLWSKTKGNAAQEILGISSICGVPMWLNTNNPNVKTLRDFTEKDRIAVPGVKTSLAAVMLHMMVAKEMGIENYAKLDPLTVTLLHPDAYNALASGKTEITAHLA